MKMRELRSGFSVSSLGVGCMPMVESGQLMYGGAADMREAERTIHKAIELGVTFFDTAEVYGPYQNESFLGKALYGKRESIVLATKFGFSIKDSGISGVDGSPQNARSAIEGSLRRLDTECIDLFYLHRVDPKVPIEETVGGMADLVREGKVRYIGLSEAGGDTIRRANDEHSIAALQSEYSLWEREIETEILPICRELGIGLVPYSPLGRGFLTGTVKTLSQLPDDDFRHRDPRYTGENLDRNLAIVSAIDQVANELSISCAQVALAWLLSKGGDVVPIPGFKRRATLEDSIKSVSVTLSAKQLDYLETAAPVGGTSGPRYGEAGMKMVRI
tara:strand:+ start:2220 stop:3215 length:996 start_codon:yes stop_codon:yes gene_type:complete